MSKVLIEHRYKDALFYGKDGNFQLNQHQKKMDDLDRPLTEEVAYYANTKKHADFVASFGQQPEFSGEVICVQE